MGWAARAAQNLLPRSKEKRSLATALTEWFYTGDAYDLGQPQEDCELCDRPEIRYQFLIRNRFTQSELLIGSECINRFQILAIDESGKLLDESGSRKKVSRDRAKLITDAKKRRVINCLVSLIYQDQAFDIASFLDYLQDRGAFTPNQLALLFWRLDRHHVSYATTDFKVTIRRDREKHQLRQMEPWKLAKILPALSPHQREYVANNLGQT